MCSNGSEDFNLCLHGGTCSSSTGTCACPSACFVGNFCETNYNAVRLPLMGAIVQDGLSSRDAYIVVFVLFASLGLVNNILGLITFFRERIRLTNCGIYLIFFAIVNIFLMLIVLTYIMTIVRYNNPSYQYSACHIVPFFSLIMVDGSIFLTVAVAVERVLLECLNFRLYGSRVRALIVSAIILGYVCGSNVDEIFIRRISTDLLGNHICIYDFERYPIWRRIDIVFSYAHVIIPCVMHFICTVCVLTTIARRKIFINSTDNHLIYVWLHQLYVHRDFLIPPLCLITCILPHGILGHLLQTCIPYSDRVKLRLHISFILLLYVPQVISFGLYVYPNPMYLKEFQQTKIYRTIFHHCYQKRRQLRQQGRRLRLRRSQTRSTTIIDNDSVNIDSRIMDEQL